MSRRSFRVIKRDRRPRTNRRSESELRLSAMTSDVETDPSPVWLPYTMDTSLSSHLVRSHARMARWPEGGTQPVWVFRDGDFQTPFNSVGRVTIQPRAHFELEPTVEFEWCVVPLSGGLRFEGPREELEMASRAVLLTGFGHGDYGLVNTSNHPAEALLATVEVREDAESPSFDANSRMDQLDRSLLSPFGAHLGLGEIQFRSLFDRSSSAWNSIDHVLLPHGTSVGHHRNHNVEEVFVILEGSGTMRIENEVVVVAAGDCVFNPLGGAHGIINPHGKTLEFLNLSVPAGDEPTEVTDLEDSLSGLVEGQLRFND